MSTTINKNLGHVTAYAYAKAGGYTGTEAEFQTLLGNIAIDLAEIENLTVVVNTLPAGSSATSSYSDGVLTLGIPRGDTGEVSDADLAEALEDYVEKTTLDDYAQIDGYYSDMTVGDAEQLISSMYVEDSEPYSFRTTGGSADVGNREYVDAIVGGTIAWNQLVRIPNGTKTDRGVTATIDTSTGVISLSGTSATSFAAVFDNFSAVNGHKYIRTYKVLTNPNSVTIRPHAFNINWNGISEMVNASDTISTGCGVSGFTSGTVLDGITMKANIFDLTQMFGSTIADYIFSLETANAGAGVAWFKKLFPNDYYEYNAGELISVSGLQSHDMVGFNAINPDNYIIGTGAHYNVNPGVTLSTGGGSNRATSEGTNPIAVNIKVGWAGVTYISEPLIKGQTYQFTATTAVRTTEDIRMSTYLVDENNTVISRIANYLTPNTFNTLITPSMDGERFAIYVGSASAQIVTVTDMCLHLTWSGWRNGEYEPYQKHSYPLDDSLTLRGIPKLDAQNNLYYDGDEYKSDGSVTRKYGVYTITGNETWQYYENQQYFYAAVDIGAKPHNSDVLGLAIMADYAEVGVFNASTPNKSFVLNSNAHQSNNFYIKDISYGSDVNAFKAGIAGKQVVFALRTPTTETAEPYQEIQICDDFGTEEYVSTSIVPVGHNTRYPANLRDKLQHLPNLADNDGAYLIRQTNKQMSLELFRIPKAPTTDGTYTLKATVSGGTPTYTWEAEE